MSIEGFTGHAQCPNIVDNDGNIQTYPHLIAWVLNAGDNADPQSGTVPVAVAHAPLPGESASTEAVVFGNGNGPPTDPWNGRGGRRYDVYPTIYCLEDIDSFDPGQDDPWWFHRERHFAQPVTYRQDGAHTIATVFADYVTRLHIPGP